MNKFQTIEEALSFIYSKKGDGTFYPMFECAAFDMAKKLAFDLSQYLKQNDAQKFSMQITNNVVELRFE